MTDKNILDDIATKLSEALPDNLQDLQSEMKKNFKTILQGAFAKLDLVTREEFDTQAAVLAKTRQKVEKLTKLVEELEKNQ